MRWTALAMVAAWAAPATAQEQAPDEIVVTAQGKPMRVDAKILRVAARRFAGDRPVFAPAGTLRFELWRGGQRLRGDAVPLTLTDGTRTLPIAIGADGRIAFPAIPEGRWYLQGPASASPITLRPIVLSQGTSEADRRLGDLRAQCRVMVAMGKAQASLLAFPLIGVFDLAGGCASRRFGFYYRAEQPLASAMVGTRALKLSAKATSYEAPLSDRSLTNEARIRLSYR